MPLLFAYGKNRFSHDVANRLLCVVDGKGVQKDEQVVVKNLGHIRNV